MSKDTIQQRIAAKIERASDFERFLFAFETVFGRDRIEFELFDYDSAIGVAVSKGNEAEPDSYARIAIRFNRYDDDKVLKAALDYAKRWQVGATAYKGVIGDHILEGHEISARRILESPE
jgi:hypothetical protein